MCNDSTRSKQVETSVCRISFDGGSAKATLFISRKILLFLERFRKNCECHLAHSFLFINMFSNYTLLFHQSTMRITVYIAFDKYFYNCDVVVEIFLYLTFLIHKNSLHSKSMQNET